MTGEKADGCCGVGSGVWEGAQGNKQRVEELTGEEMEGGSSFIF